MRYRLKQTYWGSPKEGTIVELKYTKKESMPYYEGGGYSVTQDEVENYPHLWERLEDKIIISKKLFRQWVVGGLIIKFDLKTPEHIKAFGIADDIIKFLEQNKIQDEL